MSDRPKYHRYYDNIVPAELCQRVIKTFDADAAHQDKGRVSGDVYKPQTKLSTDVRVGERLLSEEGMKVWAGLDQEIYECVVASWAKFTNDIPSLAFVTNELGFEDTGYQLQRYEKGKGKFAPHIDAGCMSTAYRLAAAVIFFNTVEEGGGTRFPEWDETVAAVEGRILWFPAGWTHIHEGLIPLSGPKYIASTFMCFKGYAHLMAGGPCHKHINDFFKQQQ